jgi:pilus assembly protein CpaC
MSTSDRASPWQLRQTRAALVFAAAGLLAQPVAAQGSEVGQTLVTSVTREIDVSVGENATISASRVRSFSEASSGNIADVKLTPSGDRFLIVGRQPGTTTLLLIRNDSTQEQITINVFQRPMRDVEAELRALLQDNPGIGLRRVGARFFIEGGVSREAELERIQKIASLFPGQAESLVVLGGAAADRKINVRVDFFFVQYDRNKSHSFGVQYPVTLGGAGIASLGASYDLVNRVGGAQAFIANQPLPGLDIAASKGWAKVLKQSSVITSNGAQATFTSGGEQNYEVATGLTSAIQAIPFGTDLTVLPRFDPKTGELEITLSAEVADLTAPIAGGTALPARNRSTLSSVVSLELGQSLVLSGIRTQSEFESRRGLPLLSEIPVLGALFGTESRTAQDVEGAIFVVPSVLDRLPSDSSRLVEEALEQFEEFDGDMSEVEPFAMLPDRSRRAPVAPPPAASPSAPAPRAPAAPLAPLPELERQ